MNWKNKLSTGLITGILSPPVAFYLFCFFQFRDTDVIELLKGYAARNVLTHVISLSVLVNLPIFFAFLGSNREHSARGVIGATFLYAFLILIMKLT
jgi:hypothetical protein